MQKITTYLLVVLLTLSGVVKAQDEPKISDSTQQLFFVAVSYGGQLPGADLASRFGMNSYIGPQFGFKTNKNITFGLEWYFFFSKNVSEADEIFKGLYNSQGYFLNENGEPSFVSVFERGHIITGTVGKIFPLGKNYDSGLQVKFGAGFMRHKIRIDNEFDQTPQISGEYKKLYDRLTSGLVLSQFVGYTHFGPTNIFNYYVGFEIFEGFTKGRRDWQADLYRPYTENRFELLYGVKLGWMIPFRRRLVADYYVF
ncbi:MAG: hypothetical protein ACLGGV_07580 [Bacteroidia bacterium]